VALALRLAATWLVPALTYDGTYYLRQAERLAHGHYDWIGFPPGYPCVVLVLRPLAGDPVLAGRLASLLAGVAGVALAHRLARRHLPERWALVVALLLALHPHRLRSDVETMSEPLYGLLVVAALLLFETGSLATAGALLGAAFLVRPEALLPLAGLLGLQAWRQRRIPWTLGVGLLPVVAFAWVASLAAGHPVLSPKQGQIDLDADVVQRLLDLVKTLHASFPLPLVPLAFWQGLRRTSHLVLPCLIVFLVPLFAVHVQERLHVPALPFLAVLGLQGVAALRLAAQRRAVLVAAAAFVALGCTPGYRNLVRAAPLVPDAPRLGAALRPHLRFEDRVAGRFPLVPYYAGAGFVRAPREASYPVLLDSICALGATHLVVLESEMHHVLPQLRPLFTEARFAASEGRLEQVAWVDAPPGRRAILYRVRPPAIALAGAPVVLAAAASVTWVDTTWCAATATGALAVAAGAPAPAAPPGEPVSEPWAVPDGARMAACIGTGARRRVASFDGARGAWTEFAATAADAPSSPTWVADRIVYVRGAAPPGLRALDPRTGRSVAVRLVGLGDDLAVPEFVRGRGKNIVITLRPSRLEHPSTRVVVTATWPAEAGGDPVQVPGRWATQLRLADAAVDWAPAGDRVVASVLVTDERGKPTAEGASLCVVEPGGMVRRLTFGIDRPRRPAVARERIAFVSGGGQLHVARLPLAAYRIPPTRSYVLGPEEPEAR
jgi:hypothetical protein